MTYCDDCGDETRKRTRCKHCGKLVCAWCYHHIHGVVSFLYTPCAAQQRRALDQATPGTNAAANVTPGE